MFTEKQLSDFPAVLRDLVQAELAAGNEIAELGHSFPAAPCGACIKLKNPAAPERRISTPDLHFYDRDTSSYAGEFTTAQRHFFVLEPPHPPQPEPDMDAIRAARNISTIATSTHLPFDPEDREKLAGGDRGTREPPEDNKQTYRAPEGARESSSPPPAMPTLVQQFNSSMAIDYMKWHDGIGYDIHLIPQATPAELRAIEKLLLARNAADWRDIEALAALNTPAAIAALRSAFTTAGTEIRMAIHRHAPGILTEQERAASLVRALRSPDCTLGNLTHVLSEVKHLHPPEVVLALLHGLTQRDGGSAVHFAAMLCYLYGKAKTPFDMKQRPFFLRFNTKDATERLRAARELCAMIGADPDTCLA